MDFRSKCAFALLAAGLLTVAAGCGESVRLADRTARPADQAGAASRPASEADDAFSPLAMPPDFDRARASLSLAEIPEDPPAPAATGEVQDAELPRQALRRIEEARRLFAEQRYSETIQELERALRYNAQSHEAHQLTAIAALLSGNDERARAAAERALAIKPNDLASHYVLGRVHEKAGQLKDARREYRLALKSESNEALADCRTLTHYHLGNLLYEQRYYAAAIEQLTAFEAGVRAAGEKLAGNPELATIARLHRGSAAIRAARAQGLLGDYARAADSLQVALGQSPRDNALRAEYIRMLGRAGRMQEAAREAERLLAEAGADKDALALLMAAHRRLGNPEQGLLVIRRLAHAEPDNVDLWNLYIDALSSAKRFDEAVAALQELVSRHPGAADSRWRLIQLTRERGDWSRWLEALAWHLKNSPKDIARVQEELSRVPDEVAAQMAGEISRPPSQRRLLPESPSDDQAASALDVLLARISSRANQPQQAESLSKQAVRRTPGFLPAVLETASRHVNACEWQQAIDAIEAGKDELKAASSRLQYLLGRAYDGLDEIEPAIEHYKKSIELDKTQAEPMLKLGRLYERFGRPKDALPMFQAAIAAAPDNMQARELLIRHLLNQAALSGELGGRAASEVKDMRRLAPESPATIRAAALTTLITQGESGRKAYLETLHNLVQNDPDDTQSRQDLVTTLLAFREYEKALEQAREWARREACSAEAGELLATAHVRLLDFPAAARQLERILALYPNRESVMVLRAQVAMIVQDYDTAIQMNKRLLGREHTANPKPTYQGALMEAYREARRFDEGRRQVESWLAQAQQELEVRRLRGYLLVLDAAAGDRDGYLARVRGWLQAEPDNETLRALLLGTETGAGGPVGLIGMGRQDEAVLLALRWLNEGAQGRPDKQAGALHDLRLIGPLLTALQAAGRHAEAIEIARAQVAAARRNEERTVARQILRAVYMRAKKLEEAVALTREILADSKQLALGEGRLLVNLLSQAGQHEEAVSQANRMIENLEQQKERIEEFQKNTTNPQHRRAIEQAFEELRENKAVLLRMISSVYQRMGQRDVAEEHLRQAYRLDPAEVGINNDLGYILADAGKDLDEAERMIRLALGHEPRTAAYQDSLAWVLYKKGDLEGARTWLLRATAMQDGHDPVVYDHLGDVEWRLGSKDAAIKSWRKAVEVYEQQSRLGEAEVEPGVLDRVKAKLEAAGAGREPPVATRPADTRPAE